MARVTHFEIHATEPQRLIDFYSALLGWSFSKMGPMDYWLIQTGPPDQPGINGGLLPRRGAGPVPGQAVTSFICTVQIEDLDSTLVKNAELGGGVALPKMAVPGLAWLAYVTDPDGNILGLTQMDPTAA